MYLGLENIIENRIYMLNKRFYHNLLVDNESIFRLFFQAFNLIHDQNTENDYQLEISKISKEVQEDVEESKLLSVYHEFSIKQMLELAVNLFSQNEEDTKKIVIAHRTTGGYESMISEIS